MDDLASRKVPPAIASALYDYFQGWMGIPGFEVRPSDLIQDEYGFADEDHESMLTAVADACGITLDQPWPVIVGDSVADLAVMLAALPLRAEGRGV